MAATVSAWGKPGAWALDAEENESELLQQSAEDNSAAGGGGGEKADFPSLSAAASSKAAKKKKPQALSLQEFSAYSSGKPKGLTHDELSALPTGPRERSAEELDRNKLGGGFRSYGGGREEQPRRQGSFNRDSGRESRADETDDWGANKKSPANSGFERRERGERGGFFGGGGGGGESRADEAGNWASHKSFAPPPAEARRYERRGESGDGGGGGSDSGNWGRRSGGAFDSLRERRGGGEGDSESWGRRREESSGGGRPRLNLQPRTLPVNEEAKSEDANAVKPKGSSPFGDARPREDVLRDKAQDLKEIEEKLESVNVDSAGAVEVPKRSDKAWRRPESVDAPPRFVHCSILEPFVIRVEIFPYILICIWLVILG